MWRVYGLILLSAFLSNNCSQQCILSYFVCLLKAKGHIRAENKSVKYQLAKNKFGFLI